MMCLCLQDWTTVRGQSTIANVTQSTSEWLDLSGYQDLVTFLEVKEVGVPSGATGITLAYQTSPTRGHLFALSLRERALSLQ